MATAQILQPVLPSKPAANNDSYITGLLDEMRQRIEAMAAQSEVIIVTDAADVRELRGAFRELNQAVRNRIKWTRAA